ncbi:MAG: prolyl oligopeptidase family serine peptidase, partial [Anaerolineae bacterium]|nr:prolyl oligopeptidase family serine peptidase [Anaerolineae bacterium]
VVAWFPPTDFLAMDEQLAESGLGPTPGMEHNGPESPESLLLGEQITKIPERVKAANPATYITPAAPPFFLQHGTADDTVPVQSSITLAAALEKAIGKDNVRLELLEGAGHADPRFDAPENVDKVFAWLDERLKK